MDRDGQARCTALERRLPRLWGATPARRATVDYSRRDFWGALNRRQADHSGYVATRELRQTSRHCWEVASVDLARIVMIEGLLFRTTGPGVPAVAHGYAGRPRNSFQAATSPAPTISSKLNYETYRSHGLAKIPTIPDVHGCEKDRED